MSATIKTPLAATGTTGNNNHASIGVSPVPQLIAVEFVIEAVGATPTVTWKLQGTFDRFEESNDGAANWFDLIGLPSDNETSAITTTKTATGAYVAYLAQNHVRFAPRVRLVTSANTNVTYRANLRSQYRN